MLKFIPRHQFEALESHHSTGRKSRTFSRWNQFVHLMFMQLTGRASLRDGIQSMISRALNLYHIGAKPVSRSNFADANNQRPASLYEALFEKVYQHCRMLSPKHKFKFKNKLYGLDATVIDLSLGAFPWASFYQTKSAIKVHTLLDHSGYLPAFAAIRDGKTHKIKVAKSIDFPKGSIVAEDRAYTDYNLTGLKGRQCPHPLRRIGYRDPETKKHFVFITNNFKLSAKTIADIYKERCQTEILFRWIKTNLKIKTFTDNSRNAVMTQLYVALIAYLLLCMFKFLSKVPVSLQNLLRVIQLNLFRRSSLEELFEPPPKENRNDYINKQYNYSA